jgi:hypothetical protein
VVVKAVTSIVVVVTETVEVVAFDDEVSALVVTGTVVVATVETVVSQTVDTFIE